MSNWREFSAPKRPGPWIEKGSCGHTIAESENRDPRRPAAVHVKTYPCEACQRAQGGGKPAA